MRNIEINYSSKAIDYNDSVKFMEKRVLYTLIEKKIF